MIFFKKMLNTHLNVQIRLVTRTISETDLYGKVCGFMILAWFLNYEGVQTSLKVFSSNVKKTMRDSINVLHWGKNKVDAIYCGPAFSFQTCDIMEITSRKSELSKPAITSQSLRLELNLICYIYHENKRANHWKMIYPYWKTISH